MQRDTRQNRNDRATGALRLVGAMISDVDVWRAANLLIKQHSTDAALVAAQVSRRNSVGLDGNTKAKIHEYIQKIRTTIEAAALPDEKRDALYRKLDRLILEVDKARTDLQSMGAVYIAICDTIGQGFTKLEPVRRMINSVAALMGRAQADEEALPALPRATERKPLEAPRKQLPPPAKSRPSDLDDEIPF